MSSAATPPSPEPSRPRVVRRRGGRISLYVVVGVFVIAAIAIGAGWATGWYGLSRSSSETSVTLQGNGAGFLLALLTKWQASFGSAGSNLVNYNPAGAGAGITALQEQTVDFAATDEPLSPSDLSAMPGQTLTLPVTGGALAVIYNLPSFTGPLNITGSLLAQIYNGNITSWNDAALTADNPGLPSNTIVTVHRSDSAGATYVLTNLLSDDSPFWASHVGTSIAPSWPSAPQQEAEKGNSALAKYVGATHYTIGYVDLADALSDHLSIAAVLNPAGHYVVPTVANTQAAINNLSGQPIPPATGNWSAVSWVNSPGSLDYPLATLCYFVVIENAAKGFDPSPARAEALVQWLYWAIGPGQAYSSALYYNAPPVAILAQDALAVANMNYNGGAIV